MWKKERLWSDIKKWKIKNLFFSRDYGNHVNRNWRFCVLTETAIKILIFWTAMACFIGKCPRFGDTWWLPLYRGRVDTYHSARGHIPKDINFTGTLKYENSKFSERCKYKNNTPVNNTTLYLYTKVVYFFRATCFDLIRSSSDPPRRQIQELFVSWN
jgi:hypothetical protein